jgi:hypothetical protein
MTRRKAVVGLAVLCALCLSAFAASSASAGTTAAECSSSAPVKDFEDAHCDRAVSSGGSFGHIAFTNGTPVSVTAVNDLTGTSSPFKLSGKLAGNITHIQCTTVSGTGTVENKLVGTEMRAEFGASTTSFSNCSVLDPPAFVPCTVAVATTHATETGAMNLKKGTAVKNVTETENIEPVEESATGTEMGLKFTQEGSKFTSITLTGASCPAAVRGIEFPVEGSAIATGGRGSASTVSSSGATGIFTQASTIKFLKFAGNPAGLEGTLTFRKSGGNPLTITTTNP